MNSAAFVERRAHSRVVVDLHVEERHLGAIYYQRAVSLSMSGVFLDRTLSHLPGTRVALQLRLPDGLMHLDAEVVESPRELGMALRFVDLDRTQRSRLANAVLTMHASRDAIS
jgi:hypothetical protein